MESKTDRRILRTKRAINQAFLELFTEKDFEKITINNISERADVNRGTFYLHYMDKYDLLDQSINDHLNKMIASCTFAHFANENTGKHEAIRSLTSVFIYFEDHFQFFYTMLSNKKTAAFRVRMLEFLSESLNAKIHREGINRELDKEFIVQFMAAAFVGTVENWILSHMPHPPQRMAEQLWTLFDRNGVN